MQRRVLGSGWRVWSLPLSKGPPRGFSSHGWVVWPARHLPEGAGPQPTFRAFFSLRLCFALATVSSLPLAEAWGRASLSTKGAVAWSPGAPSPGRHLGQALCGLWS